MMDMTPASAPTTRLLPSWIDGFLEYTEGRPTPLLFRKWAAIACLAGALERRCWSLTAGSLLIPNFFIVLVAPPGIGKTQAIDPVYKIWQRVSALHVGSKSLTRASLIDQLASQKKTLVFGEGQPPMQYHSLLIPSPELGVLIPANDYEFLNTLNDLYDCGPMYSERRRTIKDPIDIENPHLHILGGTQPAYLAELLPEIAWRGGFTSRLLMIYSGQGVKSNLFGEFVDDTKTENTLVRDLQVVATLKGQFEWSAAAKDFMTDWYLKYNETTGPNHGRLTHYRTRRHMHVMKLAMVRSIDLGNSMIIRKEDVEWAVTTLSEAESHMEDVFVDMHASPDKVILDDAYNFLIKSVAAAGGKAIAEMRLVSFLSEKVPVQRVGFFLETLQRSGRMVYEPNTLVRMIRPAAAGVKVE